MTRRTDKKTKSRPSALLTQKRGLRRSWRVFGSIVAVAVATFFIAQVLATHFDTFEMDRNVLDDVDGFCVGGFNAGAACTSLLDCADGPDDPSTHRVEENPLADGACAAGEDWQDIFEGTTLADASVFIGSNCSIGVCEGGTADGDPCASTILSDPCLLGGGDCMADP